MSDNGWSRRNALKATAAGFTLGPLFHASANAQGVEASVATDGAPGAPGWRRFAVGEAEVTLILDGVRVGEGPHPTFGEDQSADDVAALMEANGLPAGEFVNFFHPALIAIGGELVLVDTGFGAAGRANGQGLLLDRMASAGFAPSDVTTVFLTHFHGDHINGLMTDGSPTFPNASLVAGRTEYEFWTSDAARGGPSSGNAEAVAAMVVPLEEDMRLVDDGEEIVPGFIAHAASGHTPGMMVAEIRSGDARFFLMADVFGQFVVSFQRPDWQVRFDMDKEAAAATRRRFLDMLASEQVSFAGYHLPFPGIGTVQENSGIYRFVPESYRLLL